MLEKTFEEVKSRIERYLNDSKAEDPDDIVNEYFEQISVEKRISEAEELLNLIREAMMTKPNTLEDRCCSGSPGVITLGFHYAYPLQLTFWGGEKILSSSHPFLFVIISSWAYNKIYEF